MTLPKVLLVEDDAATQAWVTMVLEVLPIDLVCCKNLGEARSWMLAAVTAPRLLLLDMMLPDGSGLELLEELRSWPADRRPVHVVLMSAGSGLDSRLQQAGQQVDQVLMKPPGVAKLIDCVKCWLAKPENAQTAVPSAVCRSPDQREAINLFFGGDESLYSNFATSCLEQFGLDIDNGDASIRNGDIASIRRLGHSLKSVFRLLGRTQVVELAASLERCAADEANFSLTSTAEQWSKLRQVLLDMTLR